VQRKEGRVLKGEDARGVVEKEVMSKPSKRKKEEEKSFRSYPVVKGRPQFKKWFYHKEDSIKKKKRRGIFLRRHWGTFKSRPKYRVCNLEKPTRKNAPIRKPIKNT